MRIASFVKWAMICLVGAIFAVGFKVFENANRVERLKTLCEGFVDLLTVLNILLLVITMLMAVMLANEALRRVLNAKERWLLLGAAVVFIGGLWQGAQYMDGRILNRSLNATMEYHKLMRHWEPIWAEEAKKDVSERK